MAELPGETASLDDGSAASALDVGVPLLVVPSDSELLERSEPDGSLATIFALLLESLPHATQKRDAIHKASLRLLFLIDIITPRKRFLSRNIYREKGLA